MKTHIKSTLILLLVAALQFQVRATDILFFNQDCNIDLAGADNTCQDERYNLLNLLQSNSDNNVTLLDSFNHVDFSTMLADAEALVIPDLEDSFTDCVVSSPMFINAVAQDALKKFVENGGQLIIAGSTQNVTFLNNVFGMSLSLAGTLSSGQSTKNDAEASGTQFESCPASIDNLSSTFLITSSMPSDKKCLYVSGGNGSVAYFPISSGGVLYIGFDFNDAGPGCTQNSTDWVQCMLPAAERVADSGITASTPSDIPTLSTWSLIILGICLSILGLSYMRSERLSPIQA